VLGIASVGAFVAYAAMQGASPSVACPLAITPDPGERPTLQGVSYVFRDGTRVRAQTPDGRPGRVDESGRIVFDDGTVIVHNSALHATSMTDAAGYVLTTRPDGRARPAGPWSWAASGEDANWIRYPNGQFVSDRERGCVPGDPDGSGPAPREDGRGTPDQRTPVRPALPEGRCPEGSGPHMPITASDVPRRVGDSIFYRDGTAIRGRDPQGRAGRINADGSISYANGTRVAHDSVSGDTTITYPDGRVSRTNVGTPDLRNGQYVWNDGARASAVDSSGGRGTLKPDGTISYPDGTTIRHDPRTGFTRTVYSDGRVTKTRWSAARRDDAGTWTWNDGASASGTDPDGGAGVEGDDGWIRYPDGTVISHDAGTGQTKYVRSDGTIRVSDECERTTHIVAETCIQEEVRIDKCLVGTWEMTGCGPLAWLKSRGAPITRDDMGRMVMTINDDGTFRTQGFTMDYGMEFRDNQSTRSADTRGKATRASGLWSASDGRIRACFTQGGEASGVTKVITKKGPFSAPFSTAGVAGEAGSAGYSCSTSTLTTSTPMPGDAGDIEYKFRRLSAPPRGTR